MTAEQASPVREWAQEVLALARRWFIMLRRERLNLVFSVTQPAIWLLFFGSGMGRAIDARVVGTADYLGFVLPGIIAFTVIGNGVSSAMPLLFDKEDGYLEKLMAMPISRSSVILSRFLYQTVLLAGQVTLVLAVAFAMGVRLAAGPAGFLVLMLTVALLTLAVTAAFLALAYAVPGHGTFFAITGSYKTKWFSDSGTVISSTERGTSCLSRLRSFEPVSTSLTRTSPTRR